MTPKSRASDRNWTAAASPAAALSSPLSARAAALELGVDERTVRRAIARGELPATKRAGVYRIASDALARYRARQAGIAPPPVTPGQLVPLARPQPRPAAVPTPLTSLVGRDRELAAVQALLHRPDVRLITLTGPGGIGKTRLALQVADMSRDRFDDDVAFVNLAPVTSAHHVLPAIARAFGVQETGNSGLAERLPAALASKRLLLLIDNFEHVIGQAPLVAGLLGACPHLKVIVTSRRSLDLSGEHEFPVPPLSLAESAKPIATDAAPRLSSESARLFVERAEAVDPAFAVTEQSAPAVAAICERLDGLPLAIELAAARTKILPPAALLARLDERLPLLAGGGPDQPVRLRTMRNAIAWSYDLLAPSEQTLFRRLSVCVGGCTLAAAEALAAVPAVDHPSDLSALEMVTALVKQSLLHRLPTTERAEPRFGMLEVVREFARERLDESGEAAAAHDAHAAFYADLAKTSELAALHSDNLQTLDQFEHDLGNIRAALAWLDRQGEVDRLLRMATSLTWFWIAHSHFHEGQSWLEGALARAVEPGEKTWADALFGLGWIVFLMGDAERASSLLGDSLARYRAAADALGIALALLGLGANQNQIGDHQEAAALLEEALAVAQHLTDPQLASPVAGMAYANLGVAAHEQGHLARAAQLHQAALDRHRATGSLWGEMRSLRDAGDVARDRGDMRGALAQYQASARLALEFGELRVVADVLAGLASIGAASGAYEHAARLLAAADALRERVGAAILTRTDRMAREATLNAVRGALDEARFTATWAEGRVLPEADAVATAMTISVPTAAPATRVPGADYGLTAREIAVLRRLAHRETNREIAAALFISPRTVGGHVVHILAKLGVASRRDAAEIARRAGIV